MSSKQTPSGDEGERGRAVERLQKAVTQRGRAGEEHDASAGTPRDVEAGASVRAADEEIAARERWLKAVDDNSY